MSTNILTGLRDYLYGTLSPANLWWLSEQLRQRALELRQSQPYTKEEIDIIIAESERQLAEGKVKTHEEIFKEQFFAKLDHSRQQAKRGEVFSKRDGETFDQFFTRLENEVQR